MAFINTKYHYLERHNSIKRYKRRIMVGDNLSKQMKLGKLLMIQPSLST